VFTVSALIDSFDRFLCAHVRAGSKAPQTRKWYVVALEKLRAAVGAFPAAELRPHHIIGVEFTNHFIRSVKAMYAWAVDEDLVPKNPFRKLATPPCGERERVLTRKELASLYRVSPRPFRRILSALVHTMARPGELRNLKWSQVDLPNRLLRLNKFKAKKLRKDKMKVRLIPLDRFAAELLTALERRSPDRKPEEHVFLNSRGRPWKKDALRSAMIRARARAGLSTDDGGERVVCYTLRHTAATTATENGVRDKTLAEIMGHARTATTNRYQHLGGEHLVDVIDRATARPRRS